MTADAVTDQVLMTSSDVVCAVICATNSTCLGYKINRPISNGILQCDLISINSAFVNPDITGGIFVEKYFEYIDNADNWNMKGSIFRNDLTIWVTKA